jgi:A/G-specific adenine glycosylase
MAQQTQVQRAAAAFTPFMERFPTLEALAAAPEEEVVRAFSGLGYYRRARLLHASARAVAARGSWPKTAAELARLPGFGPYTSAAVAAFAFGDAVPPIDGNGARVTARVRALELPMGSTTLLAAARAFAASLHARRATPEVWEALMELGATVCTPSSPRCDVCPLAGPCAGRASGDPTRFPLPRPQRSREAQRWVALWLERDDGCVLVRRVDQGPLLVGLWLPPFVVLANGREPATAARALAREAGFPVQLAPARVVRHGITHRAIRVFPFAGRVTQRRVAEAVPGWSWQEPNAPALPTSSLLGKLAEACRGLRPRPAGELEE